MQLDVDLAELYDIPTKRLNEQVKRNAGRFALNFTFQLSKDERTEVVGRCDHLAKLEELESNISSQYQAIAGIIGTIRQLIQTPAISNRTIGFTADVEAR